jgi:hypothetical protein
MLKEKVRVILNLSTKEKATFHIGNMDMINEQDDDNVMLILKCEIDEMIETLCEIKDWFKVEWFAANIPSEESCLYQEQIDTMVKLLFAEDWALNEIEYKGEKEDVIEND